jgi:hypothetical protein
VLKGQYSGQRLLEGKPVDVITAYLFHAGTSDDPVQLTANTAKSFQGSIVLGMGFTFDDTDTKGVANSLADLRRLIQEDQRNAEVIRPYIGYSEVADSPTHAHHRYVINFDGRPEDVCRSAWPDLMALVAAKVKPERLKQKDAGAKSKWWQFLRPRPELQAAIAGLRRVLVAGSQASAYHALAFLPAGMVYSSNLTVFAVDSFAGFASLQAQVHEIWARFFMSTLEDDLAYTPTTCFEPYPFPPDWTTEPNLEVVGQEYYDFRADLMLRNGEGLTKTYNRFHDPYEHDPDIERLRELHTEMDRAVLQAYGWDMPTDTEFLLDYEIDEEEWGTKKKPYRLRWPDPMRDQVLARLIALNGERAAEEARSGAAADEASERRRRAPRKPATAGMQELG